MTFKSLSNFYSRYKNDHLNDILIILMRVFYVKKSYSYYLISNLLHKLNKKLINLTSNLLAEWYKNRSRCFGK